MNLSLRLSKDYNVRLQQSRDCEEFDFCSTDSRLLHTRHLQILIHSIIGRLKSIRQYDRVLFHELCSDDPIEQYDGHKQVRVQDSYTFCSFFCHPLYTVVYDPESIISGDFSSEPATASSVVLSSDLGLSHEDVIFSFHCFRPFSFAF